MLSDAEVRDVAYCLYRVGLKPGSVSGLDWTDQGCGLGLVEQQQQSRDCNTRQQLSWYIFQLIKLSGGRQSGVKGGLLSCE
jgi:hypothetical protein